MPGPDLPEVPASMRSIQHYLKIATEHDVRDPVVSYWARLYAAQTALGISKKKSQEENIFLVKLMNWLEDTKKELHDNEAISNDVAAQAHLENWALQLFLYADENDRESNFSKNVIQSFYTAGLLYDVLTIFGELSEEASQNRKYAKWKAAYIHNCLKNGQTPIPGPIDQGGDNIGQPKSEEPTPPPNTDAFGFPSVPNDSTNSNVNPAPSGMPSYPNLPPSNPQSYISPASTPSTPPIPPNLSTSGSVSLNPDQMLKAQKYIKWAGSAINYDDVPTAVENLQKALHLLTTGQDS